MSVYTYKGLSFSPPPASVTVKLPCKCENPAAMGCPAPVGGWHVFLNVVPNVTQLDVGNCACAIEHIEKKSVDIEGKSLFTKVS